MAVSRNGSWIASGSVDDTVRVWEVATGTCRRTLKGHSNSVWTVGLTRDGRNVFSGSFKEFFMWDRGTGEKVGHFDGHTSWIKCCAMSNNDSWVVTGSADESLKVWDIDTGDIERTLLGHTAPVICCDVSADSKVVVSGSEDRSIRLWSVKTGRCSRTFNDAHQGYVLCCAISGDAKWVLSGGVDCKLKLWDTVHHAIDKKQEAECEQVMGPGGGAGTSALGLLGRGEGHTGPVTCCAISMDGSKFLSGSDDRSLRVWDGATGKCTNVLSGHKDAVLDCSFASVNWGAVVTTHSKRRSQLMIAKQAKHAKLTRDMKSSTAGSPSSYRGTATSGAATSSVGDTTTRR